MNILVLIMNIKDSLEYLDLYNSLKEIKVHLHLKNINSPWLIYIVVKY